MNYYKTLGLESTATLDEVKQAYRKLAMKHHPDRGGDEAQFKKIKEAYEAISSGKANHKDPFGSFWSNDPRGSNNFQDLHEIFKRGQRAGSWSWDDWKEPEVKNPDVHISIPCTLEEAHAGFTKDIEITLPGGHKKQMKVTFPSGSTADIKIRFPGEGGQLTESVVPGDLYAKIHVEPHSTWHLQGKDLYTSMRINAWQAMLGTEVELTDLSGSTVQVTVPAGTQPNTQLRLRARGFNIRGTTQRGNAFITIDVVVPRLDETDREKLVNAGLSQPLT
jgi:DnaJ-class molecular chaperone